MESRVVTSYNRTTLKLRKAVWICSLQGVCSGGVCVGGALLRVFPELGERNGPEQIPRQLAHFPLHPPPTRALPDLQFEKSLKMASSLFPCLATPSLHHPRLEFSAFWKVLQSLHQLWSKLPYFGGIQTFAWIQVSSFIISRKEIEATLHDQDNMVQYIIWPVPYYGSALDSVKKSHD